MKTAYLTPVLAALLSGAMADFQIYTGQGGAVTGGMYTGFYFFDTEPSCDDANNAVLQTGLDDVSGTKYGVRCAGPDNCSSGRTTEITEFEMNFENWGHFTLYEDRSYAMTAADGSADRGTCVRNSDDDFQCVAGPGEIDGLRFFLCTSDLGKPPGS